MATKTKGIAQRISNLFCPRLIENYVSSSGSFGSGFTTLMVGGIVDCCIDTKRAKASKAPAAPRRCPVIDLVEDISVFHERPDHIDFMAACSARSPTGVDVPCTLM